MHPDNPPFLNPPGVWQPFLLAADIDGTLLGDEEGEALLNLLAEQYAGSLYLAFITGRTLKSVQETVAEGRLPEPDFICGFVGTELLDCRDPANTIGQNYASQVSPTWDLEAIYALGEGAGIRRQQFMEGQPRFQAGFDWDGQANTLAAFRQRLEGQGEWNILPSHGRYIDVLPPPLGKGQAVCFLQKTLALPPERVIVAGDTGNDRQMFETEFQGVLPLNALDELKAIADPTRHYQSPFPAGRGVIDGLRHFGLIV